MLAGQVDSPEPIVLYGATDSRELPKKTITLEEFLSKVEEITKLFHDAQESLWRRCSMTGAITFVFVAGYVGVAAHSIYSGKMEDLFKVDGQILLWSGFFSGVTFGYASSQLNIPFHKLESLLALGNFLKNKEEEKKTS